MFRVEQRNHCHTLLHSLFIVYFSDVIISLIKKLILATDVACHSDYLELFQVIIAKCIMGKHFHFNL